MSEKDERERDMFHRYTAVLDRLAKAEAALKALTAQLDADTERDASRYQWLRNGDKRKGVMSFDGLSLKAGDALDAVIDAAILGEDGK